MTPHQPLIVSGIPEKIELPDRGWGANNKVAQGSSEIYLRMYGS